MNKTILKLKPSYESFNFLAEEQEVKRWLYISALPIMWLLAGWVVLKKLIRSLLGLPKPKTNTLWFDGWADSCRNIKEGAASWRALDIIYNYKNRPGHYIENFWLTIRNSQAVRNRSRLVKRKLADIITITTVTDDVRIISIAAGSAQAVVGVLANLGYVGETAKVLLIDVDDTALAYAKKLIKSSGLDEKNFETVCVKASRIRAISENFRPNIIEMSGLLDYLPDNIAIRLIQKIRESLPKGGWFITCNIRHNLERFYLSSVVEWPMIYRTPNELKNLIKEAGFIDYYLEYEPLGIHGVIVARKK